MKNPKCYGLCIIAVVGMLLHSCLNEDDYLNNDLNSTEIVQDTIIHPDKIIGLGKKLENPYTVSVMKQAYENLKIKKPSSFTRMNNDSIIIETTDYYVRFLPETDEEKELLQDQDSLTLFDMPLDYELEEGVGGAYHDPTIPEGDITWQYSVVPVDYQFRDIQYEILANLFLQDEEEEEEETTATRSVRVKTLKQQLSDDLWAELQSEALKITGNEDDIVNTSASRGRKWYPSGQILYEDNTTSIPRIIPLQGAKVIVKRWFKWKRDITDANGNFRVGKFRSRKVKCAIKWERHDWDIRSGSYGQAWYSFETLRRGNTWNITIKKNSTPRNWFYASIHRGAMEYFTTTMPMAYANPMINRGF